MPERKTGGLDWAEARARLERMMEHAAQAGDLSPEKAREVLDARALELARPPLSERAAGDLLEVARFRLGGQMYALATRYLHEVLRAPELTPLPGAPALLRGLTLLRGEVLPVVELTPLFGRAASGTSGTVLVMGLGRAELGLCAEAVEEVTQVPRDDLLPVPTALAEVGDWVSSIHRDGTIFLEGEALLGDSRLIFDISDEGAA
ncbi:chemotaxis protein CheW [Stigmatella sp. ncwal1]|uniref:Chemotaxis protein CheW n=1 Tax=Stigmatella ashevillensis TaxID=2995309 RepID=A0ABT5DK20_9BACT|nr:chemotaxis protein CheW [Stigmatella ashevillena]MDC0712711.1 chemotaxis protein CheW [Stigmatella ashevillena]